MKLSSGLYIVSTPIGNLGDITLRAIEVLSHSDLILCEDTRVTSKLLAKHNITTRLKIYNDNSDEKLRKFIAEQIISGKVISLVSDAGTPLISDPGYKLVRQLKEQNIHLDVIPGPCAAIASLTLSGLATDKFFFYGFLPKSTSKLEAALDSLKSLEASLILYESPARLLNSLQSILKILGRRKVNVTRELTKLYQTSITEDISELIQYYSDHPPKGEVTIIIEGAAQENFNWGQIEQEALALLNQNQSVKTATEILKSKYDKLISRTKLYKMINELKKS